MHKEILAWSKKTDFILISEGEGEALSRDDIANGYVDYINLLGISYHGNGDFSEGNKFDGGVVLLKTSYQEQFKSTKNLVDYLIAIDEIPVANYTIISEIGWNMVRKPDKKECENNYIKYPSGTFVMCKYAHDGYPLIGSIGEVIKNGRGIILHIKWSDGEIYPLLTGSDKFDAL